MIKINIKEISTFLELNQLSDLLQAYLNNHTDQFFVKFIGYNDNIPRVFLIDDMDNYWILDINKKGYLRKMTKTEKKDANYGKIKYCTECENDEFKPFYNTDMGIMAKYCLECGAEYGYNQV